MNQQRTARLNELLRRELSRLIRRELKDPRVQTVTVTDVVTAPDLTHATVYIRTLDDEVGAEQAVEGLASASGFMRRRLGKLLRLRRVPEFHFEVDHTLERATRIEQLLEEARQDGPDEPGAD
jgi:ribosome-binding factor A